MTYFNLISTCNSIKTNFNDEFVEGTKKSSYGVRGYRNSLKLFVFGDSYVDTGNFLNSPSYKPPYGITFPHQPSGRFSDGRVLTDYIGNSPIFISYALTNINRVLCLLL